MIRKLKAMLAIAFLIGFAIILEACGKGEQPVRRLGESVSFCDKKGGSWFVIDNKDQLWGWGSNKNGQLGLDRSLEKVEAPMLLMNDVASVVYDTWTESEEYYALKTNGEVWRWGNIRGIGANRTKLDKPEHFMDDVISIQVYADSWFAIKKDNSLWAWGLNDYHQLGTGEVGSPKREPIRVLDNVKSLYVSGCATFALCKDASLWAWGVNGYGMTGTGVAKGNVQTPKRVLDDVESVTVGYDCVFAIQNDGDLYAWGSNEYGQLGDGTTTDKARPQRIMDSVKRVVLGSGAYYTTDIVFAIRKDNTLYRWGSENVSTPEKIQSEIDSITSISDDTCYTLTKKMDKSLWFSSDEGEKKLLNDVNQYGLLGFGAAYALSNSGKLFAYWDWNEDGIEIADDVAYVGVISSTDELYAIMNNGSLWLFSENKAEKKLFDGVRLP